MKTRCMYLIILVVIANISFAQAIIKVNQIPRYYTPLRDTIFVAGSFNNWNPQSVAHRLIKQTDGSYQMVLSGTVGETISYKFTRGSFNSVETQLNGNYLPDRTFTFANGITIDCQIENWEDMLGWHTAVGNTFILDLDFPMPQLNRTRRIWIYLPPDYFTSNNHYPVMYAQDGQNLFDLVYAPFGEWNIDSTMEALYGQFSPSAIVVGIDNSNHRIDEYSPWVNSNYGGGQGDLYAQFIVNTLKPYIDANFRTLPHRDYTAIIGSSMGGLISFYTSIAYRNVIGKAAIFSPSFWFSDTIFSYLNTVTYTHPMRLYFMAGQNESSTMISKIQSVMSSLQAQGFPSSDMILVNKSDGQHSEWFWRREFGDAFMWLFQTVTQVPLISDDFIAYYVQLDNKIILTENAENVFLYNMKGQIVASGNNGYVDTRNLVKGLYVLSIQNTNSNRTQKIFVY